MQHRPPCVARHSCEMRQTQKLKSAQVAADATAIAQAARAYTDLDPISPVMTRPLAVPADQPTALLAVKLPSMPDIAVAHRDAQLADFS